MKKVLCLGAGLVARPYIQYLSDNGFHVFVASRTKSKAEHLIDGCENAEVIVFNIVTDDALLDELTAKTDLVCSLLPYVHHVKAAKAAIKHKKHFCTTSYISAEMKALEGDAKKAGVLLLNECGVDPGIDHMSAMRIIDQVHSKGGKVKSFTSVTGGLPAPDDNNNPYGYKVSWTPRGVLLAGRNDAHFLRDGKEVLIRGGDLFHNYELMEMSGLGTFEAYPNRDSMSYIEIYNIPETETMLRGTLRNRGWCETLDKIASLGLLDVEERSLTNMTYAAMMRNLTSARTGDIRTAVAKFCGIAENHPILKRLEWLGLLDEVIIPSGITTRLDALCHLFEQKLQYAPGERDMLVMHHEFMVEYKDKKQKITSTLIDYGIPNGDSSMSRTVALPVAIASRMILEGKIKLTGVHRPVIPSLYDPILQELAGLGISLEEHVSDL